MLKKEKIRVSKRIENEAAYELYNSVFAAWDTFNPGCFSEKTVNCFDAFIQALNEDIGRLKCDEYAGSYTVEYGFIYKKS